MAYPLSLRLEPEIQDPRIAEYTYLERHSGGGTQTYSKHSANSELPKEFQPKTHFPPFGLPVVSIPKPAVLVVLADPHPDLLQKYVGCGDHVAFCVHPAHLGNSEDPHMQTILKMQRLSPLTVVPTASSRTVTVLTDSIMPHAVKTHCPLRISYYHRTLDENTIRHSVTLSKELAKTVAFLPETIGVALPEKDGKSGWGFIIREMIPRPAAPNPRKLIPCFALYGTDLDHPEEPPLLVKMIQKSGQNPKKYILNHIMYPIITDFITVFKTHGVLLEAHGQNSLLEVDEDFLPTRIVHRDFDESVDARVRRSLDLSLEGLNPEQIIDQPSEEEPEGSVHSYVYDASIGRVHFRYLAEMAEQFFGVKVSDFQEACKAKFLELFPDHANYFPRCTYTLGAKAIRPNVFPLIENQDHPSWRP